MKKYDPKIKSEYTEEELKKYYLLNCLNEKCNWKGLSKDIIDIKEDEDGETIYYLCPHCKEVLTIVK